MERYDPQYQFTVGEERQSSSGTDDIALVCYYHRMHRERNWRPSFDEPYAIYPKLHVLGQRPRFLVEKEYEQDPGVDADAASQISVPLWIEKQIPSLEVAYSPDSIDVGTVREQDGPVCGATRVNPLRYS
jgi:hypothetical protein